VSRQQRAASIGFELNSGWAILYEGNAYDLLRAGGPPYPMFSVLVAHPKLFFLLPTSIGLLLS